MRASSAMTIARRRGFSVKLQKLMIFSSTANATTKAISRAQYEMQQTKEKSSIRRAAKFGILFLAAFLFFGGNVSLGESPFEIPHAEAAIQVQNWWPVNNAKVEGVQPFKFIVPGMDVSEYDGFWQVGDGRLNQMQNRYEGHPHKKAEVDLSGWTWERDGKYSVTFIAKEKSGREIARKKMLMRVDSRPFKSERTESKDKWRGEKTEDHTDKEQDEVSSEDREREESESDDSEMEEQIDKEFEDSNSQNNSLAGKRLYVSPNTNAGSQAREWRQSRPEDAKLMDIIASEAQAIWLGGWNHDIENEIRREIQAAKNQDAIAVFVAYNIPHRDCGLYSAGGVRDPNEYRDWINKIARGINGSTAVVILEPDALAGADCLEDKLKAERKQMISEAIKTLKNSGAIVYVESSLPPWKSTEEMAKRLREVGVENADGFALNTSSFTATEQSIQYGYEISDKLGGMHFVVDTSRNGRGQNEAMEWCNPWGRGLGEKPTTNTGRDRVDAFLWTKSPGESDGNCNGGPNAGEWFPEYALDLVKNRAF